MKLLTKNHHDRLLRNGRFVADHPDFNNGTLKPVVKLFTLDASCTWLLTEIYPDGPDIAFGLCDLGLRMPELGTVNLSELAALRGRLGLPVERERHFQAEKTLLEYANEASKLGYIKA